MIRTDNPVADMERYEEETARRFILPQCEVCGDLIQDEHCYMDDDGSPFCICIACMRREVGRMAQPVQDMLEMAIDKYWERTPVEEVE